MGTLATADMTMLAAYCLAWSQFCDASNQLAETGMVSTTDKGNEIQHPMVGVMNKAFERLHKAAQQFGLTPASRARVVVKSEEHADEFEEFISGTRTKE